MLAASAGGKSGFAELTTASNFDHVEESDTKSEVVMTVASNWQNAFAVKKERNSVVEEVAANTHWGAEVKAESNSSAVVVARVGHIRRIVVENFVQTGNAAVETVVSNSAVFEEKIVSKENVAAAEKPADN